MIDEAAIVAILGAANEDSIGLWEVGPLLGPTWRGRAEKLADAERRVVRHILARGWVELLCRNGPTGEEVPISQARWGEVLRADVNWNDPKTLFDLQYLVATTDSGYEAYRSLLKAAHARESH